MPCVLENDNLVINPNRAAEKDYPQLKLSTSLQVVFCKHGTMGKKGTFVEFFCDLSKTFYTIIHKVLLQKLKLRCEATLYYIHFIRLRNSVHALEILINIYVSTFTHL